MTRDRVIVSLTGRTARDRAETLERARRRDFVNFAAPPQSGTRPRSGETWFRSGPGGFLSTEPSDSAGPVPIRAVRTPSDLAGALRAAGKSGSVAIRWLGARVIPLESALAERPPGSAIWVIVRDPRELPAALGALETGANRVVVEVEGPDGVDALEDHLEEAGLVRLRWTSARVTQVRTAGLSERVLVDTTSMLMATEGLLLGSSAALLFHVVSEAQGSSFTRPRPFRVNAGSPHLYVLMADGTTRYLSELEAGDRLLVASPRGSARAVRVGRLKVERRPMLMVRADHRGQGATAFVQEAETVRLSGPRGSVPVTELRIGTKVRATTLPPARHLGKLVHESIEER